MKRGSIYNLTVWSDKKLIVNGHKEFFRMKKCLELGMAVLSLALVFAACGDLGTGQSASEVLVIGPAPGPIAQVNYTGAYNGRSSRPGEMVYEFSVAANSFAVLSGMAYIADNCSQVRTGKAYNWASGERGPPGNEGGIA